MVRGFMNPSWETKRLVVAMLYRTTFFIRFVVFLLDYTAFEYVVFIICLTVFVFD